MNYTKFIFFKNSPIRNKEKFEFSSSDEKLKLSMEMLKDIKKTLFIIHNYMRIDFKIDIDEHLAYFLKDKNQFMNVLKDYLERNGRKLSQSVKNNYLAILEILKTKIDLVLKEFKVLKQKILKKLNKKETFYKIKEDFLKSFSIDRKSDLEGKSGVRSFLKNVIISGSKSIGALGASTPPPKYKGSPAPINKSKPFLTPNLSGHHSEGNLSLPEQSQDDQNIYTDNPSTINLFKNSESKDLEKTKQILFELSDLVNTFSHKVVEQHQMTENIIQNSQQSLENIKDANKELVKSQEYQKGRGITIGLIFIVLGLFLIYYDYTL